MKIQNLPTQHHGTIKYLRPEVIKIVMYIDEHMNMCPYNIQFVPGPIIVATNPFPRLPPLTVIVLQSFHFPLLFDFQTVSYRRQFLPQSSTKKKDHISIHKCFKRPKSNKFMIFLSILICWKSEIFTFFHILKFKCFVQNGSTWTIKKF